jgi:catechol 2,3-dioxygenase-like lactoylglutathione lyase family enzyme
MKPLTSSSAGTEGNATARASTSSRRPGEGRPKEGEAKAVAELLGFEGTGEYRGAFLYWGSAAKGPYLDLLEWRDAKPPVPRSPQNVGLSRVAIQVDDLDAQLARLEEHGVPTLTAPKEFVLGVTRVRVVCFRDPDDVLLEYLEYVDKPWGT